MLTSSLCGPAILYIGFSLIQIIIDLYKKFYNAAFIKMIVMLILALTINVLCEMGLHVIAWFLVFIPIIMMTIISTLLLKTFGTDPNSNFLKSQVVNENETSNENINDNFDIERIDRDKKRRLFYDKIESAYDLSSNIEDLYDLSNNKVKYFISNFFLNDFANNFFMNSINNIGHGFTNFGSSMINPLFGYSSFNKNAPHVNSLPMTANFELRSDNMNGTDFESYKKLYSSDYKLDGKIIFDAEQRRRMQLKYPNDTEDEIDKKIEDAWQKLSIARQNSYNREASESQSGFDYEDAIYDPENMLDERVRLRSKYFINNRNNRRSTQSYEPCQPGKEKNSLNMCVLPCPIGQERLSVLGKCKNI